MRRYIVITSCCLLISVVMLANAADINTAKTENASLPVSANSQGTNQKTSPAIPVTKETPPNALPASTMPQVNEGTSLSNNATIAGVIGGAAGSLMGLFSSAFTSMMAYRSRKKNVLDCQAILVNNYLASTKENYPSWLDREEIKYSTIGKPIEYAARFTRDQLEGLRNIQKVLFEYLTENEFKKLTAFITAANLLETLMEGFCADLSGYMDSKINLAADDVEFLQKKCARIRTLLDSLPQNVNSLSDLPSSYKDTPPSEIICTAPRQLDG